LGFKTNRISRAKNVNQSEKHGRKSAPCEALNETGKWKIETGNWNWKLENRIGMHGRQFPISIFQFPLSNSVPVQAAIVVRPKYPHFPQPRGPDP
jgi:hypothetical protein